MCEILANLIKTLTSEVGNLIQKHPGPGGEAPGGRRGAEKKQQVQRGGALLT